MSSREYIRISTVLPGLCNALKVSEDDIHPANDRTYSVIESTPSGDNIILYSI